MNLFQGLESSPVFLVCTVAILGLLVGSFLNVVILRLPRMMEIAWKKRNVAKSLSCRRSRRNGFR